MKKKKADLWRDKLFQYAYDFGLSGACEKLGISEEKFWDVLYPPVVRVEFPTYAKKDVVCPGELSDIINTSYQYLRAKLVDCGRDDISQSDSLQDAIVITIQKFADCESFDRELVRASITEVYYQLEYYRRINRQRIVNGQI